MVATASPAGGIVRPAKRPEGWRAAGPRPSGPRDRVELWPREGEDLCYLCGEWRILQKIEGHRWSLDDLVTAWYALEVVRDRDVRHHVDLGCGIGSVLMMAHWRMPSTRCVGVEVQEVSVDLARRSIAFNGIEKHVEVRLGDLRDRSVLHEGPIFDLVTGTPPYIPLGAGNVSERVQCGPCRHEQRGGVEAYCEAAASCMAPKGRLVLCEDARQVARVEAAAETSGLTILSRRDVIPRAGRDPLFSVYAFCHQAEKSPAADGGAHVVERPLVVRNAHGVRTRDYQRVRCGMGMPA